jgi:hypothetical protein
MAREDYVKQGDAEFCAQMLHMRDNLPQFFDELTITAADPHVVTNTADALCFEYLCNRQSTLTGASSGATSERNRTRYGDKQNPNTPVTLGYPAAPASIPSPIKPGVEKRFRILVEFLRTRPGWNDDIAATLQVLGADQDPADADALKPFLPLSKAGGHVQIGWKWQSARGVARALRIEVDRGNGWELLAIDTQPGYTDKTPWPAAAKWKYRAIFVRDEDNIGQWSDVAEITVGA